MRQPPRPVRPLLDAAFAARRAWYRLRYPRLEVGKDVLFIGRLRLRAGTRLVLGDHVRIRKTVIVNGGGEVRIGAHTLLNGCWVGTQFIAQPFIAQPECPRPERSRRGGDGRP